MRAITWQRYTRFLHIAKHGTKTGKGLRSSHGFFPSEVSNNMLCDHSAVCHAAPCWTNGTRRIVTVAHGTQDQHDYSFD